MIGLSLFTVAIAFSISLPAVWMVRQWARRTGFVDQPAGHKAHAKPVALGGGIAILAGVALPIIAGAVAVPWLNRSGPPDWLPTILQTHLPGMADRIPLLLAVLGCTVVLHIVGLIDDHRPLGPRPKFAVQLAVALVTSWFMGVRVAEFLPAPLSVALTVLWIVFITNAFNFLDNMDGLSSGVAAIAAAIFAMTAIAAGQIFVPTLAWLLVGSLLGFLIFNFSPASVFMGDAGSLVIGYLLSVITILTTYYDPSLELTPLGVIVPLVVLAVPLYDVVSVVVHRLRLGESPFRGDRRHFSHRLVNRGLSPRGAVLTIYLATAATGLPAIVLPRVDWPAAILLLIQCLCVVTMIAILEHTPGKR
jgi:UDP-GlcNAc:undecaprenyl-phosphate/decaprenyl-phosphate GlcNAc-1-phosphate transferase